MRYARSTLLVRLRRVLRKALDLPVFYPIHRWIRPIFSRKPYRFGEVVIYRGDHYRVTTLVWRRTDGRWGYHAWVFPIPKRTEDAPYQQKRLIPAWECFRPEPRSQIDPMGPLRAALARRALARAVHATLSGAKKAAAGGAKATLGGVRKAMLKVLRRRPPQPPRSGDEE